MKTESTAGQPYAAVAGLMLALDCKPAGAALHLYGFNWSRRHWKSHAIAAEERFIRTMVRLQLKPQPLHHPHHGVCAAVRQTQQTFSHRQGGERLCKLASDPAPCCALRRTWGGWRSTRQRARGCASAAPATLWRPAPSSPRRRMTRRPIPRRQMSQCPAALYR